ncbi:hypothetical protein J6590_063417 [Homalodisca vitripennis]|nr:hypothetical protein J6590_063417 [Homalodisca vitripennis]
MVIHLSKNQGGYLSDQCKNIRVKEGDQISKNFSIEDKCTSTKGMHRAHIGIEDKCISTKGMYHAHIGIEDKCTSTKGIHRTHIGTTI